MTATLPVPARTAGSEEHGRSRRSRPYRVALVGIDGSGKTSAAEAVRARFAAAGEPVAVHGIYAGRKTLERWADRLGTTAERVLGRTGLSAVENVIRATMACAAYRKSRDTGGLVLFDRSLYCQLARDHSRGLVRRSFSARLLNLLPRPDLVVYFDIPPEQALARVALRGEDSETLPGLARFAAGYRALPEFRGFAVIDAGGPRADVADQLEQLIRLRRPAPGS
ncbi:dTMP kinase [Arthrobacter mangrovi]|uniref:Thymidylate kinase n=1 Tax=Arthrobacter mangrovi TaxID=2966350 RepID=A0ABQ5MYZ7_9MICC|nr:thymidylate kinase [Arthrobacter mangrovi]GLB69085.1 thymidylate kinase [Arthrobacter mangrovi]